MVKILLYNYSTKSILEATNNYIKILNNKKNN